MNAAESYLHQRIATLESIVRAVVCHPDETRMSEIKVYRNLVPELFAETDGSALYLRVAAERALLLGQ